MNRLQKKCVVASAGFHLLLCLILLIGPAFVSSKKNADELNNLQPLDFIPLKTVDALMSGGGSPNATPPASMTPPPREATPEPPAPPPQPKPLVKPEPKPEPEPEEPVKEVVKEYKKVVKEAVEEKEAKRPDDESLELSKNKPKKREISTTLVKRKVDSQPDAKAKARARAEADEQAELDRQIQAYNDSRRRAAHAFGNAVSSIGTRVSGSTSIEFKGPGGGGVPYANFNQAVISAYKRAWIVPDGVTDKDATVETIVIIGRDGTVLAARITHRSGISELDRSVQRVLDRVKYAAPLPDDAQEDRREVPINFNATLTPSIG
jgi:colicin import membrane protein